jgi:transposase
MNVTLIGIDLAKSVFQVCAVNQAGKVVFNHQVRRSRLLETVIQHPGATVVMEACSGSNYWGRTFQAHGFDVKLIPPQHVKPFVKGNKNDRNDAFAICEASQRPHLRTVTPRTLEQTDIMLAHRVLERRKHCRVQLMLQIRGFLQEYGIVLPTGKARLRSELPLLLEDAGNGLTDSARRWLADLLCEWQALDRGIAEVEQELARQVNEEPAMQRLKAIRGVGDHIASAVFAQLGDGSAYRNGRQFAASLGLVPKEHSSGGKQRLGSITKRGNKYLRYLLIQGAWSVINACTRSDDRLSRWARTVMARRGKHKAAVAIANKLARILWAVSYRQEAYRPA